MQSVAEGHGGGVTASVLAPPLRKMKRTPPLRPPTPHTGPAHVGGLTVLSIQADKGCWIHPSNEEDASPPPNALPVNPAYGSCARGIHQPFSKEKHLDLSGERIADGRWGGTPRHMPRPALPAYGSLRYGLHVPMLLTTCPYAADYRRVNASSICGLLKKPR